jgi:hypothetical protein
MSSGSFDSPIEVEPLTSEKRTVTMRRSSDIWLLRSSVRNRGAREYRRAGLTGLDSQRSDAGGRLAHAWIHKYGSCRS